MPKKTATTNPEDVKDTNVLDMDATPKPEVGAADAPNLPEKLQAAIDAGYTAYVSESGDAWFFNEATAKKYFEKYTVITPKQKTENGTSR